MNYEELISSGAVKSPTKRNLPIGLLTKGNRDGKLANLIELRKDLADDPMFKKAIDEECRINMELKNAHLLHFVKDEADDSVLNVEQGNFVSMERLLNDSPASLASKKFIDNVFLGLLDAAEYLHSQGINHEYFAPSSVFFRKGDSSPLLVTHGSIYGQLVTKQHLYEGFESYVAPEVMEGGTIDERCDIYSIGKFMETVFEMAAAPYEYKRVVKKATSQMPEDRYQSIAEMRKALAANRHTAQSFKMGVAAVVIALLCVGGYFYLLPEANTVQYVKPAPKEPDPDLLDDGFDPETELGPVSDSVANLTPEKLKKIEMYQAKSESIFRKRFTAEAENILSRVYSKQNMSASEKQFLAGSSSMTDELGKAQVEIANQAGLDGTRSNAIASEIIEKISEQKKKELKHYGVQK